MIVGVKICEAKDTIKKYEDLGYRFISERNIGEGYLKLTFRDPIVLKENNITDIQFHEGDYVENSDGKIGYISSICHCTVSSDYKQIGTQKFSTEDILKNKIAALEKENKELKGKVNNLTHLVMKEQRREVTK